MKAMELEPPQKMRFGGSC